MDSYPKGRTSQGLSEEVNLIRKMQPCKGWKGEGVGTKAWAGKRVGHLLGTGDHCKLRVEARSFRALILSEGHWNATEGRDVI